LNENHVFNQVPPGWQPSAAALTPGEVGVAYSQAQQAHWAQPEGRAQPAQGMQSAQRTLHPRHGIHNPTTGTPRRAPGSLRRTSTIDMLRPDGLFGPLVLIGRARDLVTNDDGSATVLGMSSCQARIDFTGGRLLTEISTDPDRPGLQELIGERVSSGFRAAVKAADPGLATDDSLLYLLLDDFPVATLVSGHAIGAGMTGNGRAVLSLAEATGQPLADVARTADPAVTQGAAQSAAPRPGMPPGFAPSSARPAFKRNLCAGFADGGTIMNDVDTTGRPPIVTGPEAPALTTDDELGWHETVPLPPLAMRRSRRMDVIPGPLASIDVLYRDSHVDDEGLETIVHEYTVSAAVDTSAGVLAWCAATPRVLPWVECPAAALSAGRLVGMPVAGLRRHVRDTFLGTSTCTHLNDTLRSLEDIPALLDLAGRTTSSEPAPDRTAPDSTKEKQ
jgi:hypothetical protein